MRTLPLTLMFIGAAAAVDVMAAYGGQSAAECQTVECARAQDLDVPPAARLWPGLEEGHQARLAWVAGLLRFTRAQAGTFGDERQELEAALAGMQAALTRWDASLDGLARLPGVSAGSAERHIALATAYLERGRVDAALGQLKEAERAEPERADTYRLKALAQAAAGQTAAAAATWRLAASREADDVPTAYLLARSLRDSGRPDQVSEALAAFTRLVSRPRAPDHPHVAEFRPFQRLDLLRQPAGVAPIFPLARYSDGYAALAGGDYSAALRLLSAAVANETLRRSDGRGCDEVVQGAASLRGGQLGQALTSLAALVQRVPECGEAHRAFGVALWVDGQPAGAIDELKAAALLTPADERSRLLLADILASAGRASEAQRELERTLEAAPQSGRAHYALATIFEAASRLPESVEQLDAAAARTPIVGLDHVYHRIGDLRLRQARFDEAIAAYDRRIDLDPNDAEAHRQLGEIHFLIGQDDAALAECLAAVWLDPGNARAYASAGQLYLRLDRHREAAEMLERAVTLDATQRQARYALGTAWLRLGRTAEGLAQLEIVQRETGEADARGQRAFRLEATQREATRDLAGGDIAGAVVLLSQLVSETPDDARAQQALGFALIRQQRPAEAVAALEAAQRLQPSAEAARALAGVYRTLGRMADADREDARGADLVRQAKGMRLGILGATP